MSNNIYPSYIEMAFAEMGVTSNTVKQTIMDAYSKNYEGMSIPQYIKRKSVDMSFVADVIKNERIRFSLYSWTGKFYDDSFCTTLLKDMFVTDCEAYRKRSDYECLDDYVAFLTNRLLNFIVRRECVVFSAVDKEYIKLKSSQPIATRLAMLGILVPTIPRKVFDLWHESKSKQSFMDYLSENYVLDSAVQKVLSYPDPKGFLKKKFSFTDNQVVDYVRQFLKDDTSTYCDIEGGRIQEPDLEREVITALRSYADRRKTDE